MKRTMIVWILLICMLSAWMLPGVAFAADAVPDATGDNANGSDQADNETKYEDVLPMEPSYAYCEDEEPFVPDVVNYDALILFNPNSGDFIYEDHPEITIPMNGSIAMLMTVRLSVKHLELDRTVILSNAMLSDRYEDESPYLYSGRSVRVIELISAMLLYESKQAAYVLSYLIAGRLDPTADTEQLRESVVIEEMNVEAQRLNMTSTYYANCVGEKTPEQLTTPRDIVRLLYSLHYWEEEKMPVANTDYLVGCATRGAITGELAEEDPRNKLYYDPSILGYAFHAEQERTVMALSRRTEWKTPSGANLDGELFVVAVAEHSDAVRDILTLTKRVEATFGLVNCSKMLASVSSSFNCPYCTGTMTEHKMSCSYPARQISLLKTTNDRGRERYFKAVDFSALATLGTYSAGSMAHITAKFQEGDIDFARNYEEGDPFARLSVFFDDRELIRVQSYVMIGKSEQNREPILSQEPVTEKKPKNLKTLIDAVEWQTWVLFGIGVPIVIVAVALPLHAYRKMKKM